MHIMLDIETMSTRTNAHILQVALVAFCPMEGVFTGDAFNMFVSTDGQEERAIDMSTVRWWLQQDPEIQERVLYPRYSYSLPEVLLELRRWFAKFDHTYLWCKGPEFDTAILKHAYEQLGQETPWQFGCVRDVRTARYMSRSEADRPNRGGPSHDALDDCHEQILDVMWDVFGIMDPAENRKNDDSQENQRSGGSSD